jgi:hypothetical protein
MYASYKELSNVFTAIIDSISFNVDGASEIDQRPRYNRRPFPL